VLSAWALWDLILLHGDNDFQQHWCGWTGIRLFSSENPGGEVIETDLYLRLLLSLVIAGVATAIKRTALALYFGKKTVLNYKTRMDKILADMAILADVGQLASEAQNLVEAASDNQMSINAAVTRNMGSALLSDAKWQDIAALDASSEEGSHNIAPKAKLDQLEEAPETAEPDPTKKLDSTDDIGNESLTSSGESDDDNSPEEESDGEDDNASGGGSRAGSTMSGDPEAAFASGKQARYYSKMESRSLSRSDKHFKNLLDRWDEPENKTDKVSTLVAQLTPHNFCGRTHALPLPLPISPRRQRMHPSRIYLSFGSSYPTWYVSN